MNYDDRNTFEKIADALGYVALFGFGAWACLAIIASVI